MKWLNVMSFLFLEVCKNYLFGVTDNVNDVAFWGKREGSILGIVFCLSFSSSLPSELEGLCS